MIAGVMHKRHQLGPVMGVSPVRCVAVRGFGHRYALDVSVSSCLMTKACPGIAQSVVSTQSRALAAGERMHVHCRPRR